VVVPLGDRLDPETLELILQAPGPLAMLLPSQSVASLVALVESVLHSPVHPSLTPGEAHAEFWSRVNAELDERGATREMVAALDAQVREMQVGPN
jgi:hypothetical protein